MTATVGTATDLADLAEHRARTAQALARLLTTEPGPPVADLVAGVPELAALGADDPELPVEFERVLLRAVPLYESVFTSATGQLGGSAVSDIATFTRRSDIDRDALPASIGRVERDHLGAELAVYAQLCAREAAAWRHDRPEQATIAVERQRALLRDHLGSWAEVALDAAARAARGGPLATLALATADYLAAECERLRPAPHHPTLPPVTIEDPPPSPGSRDLARWLLTPARCGTFLLAGELARASRHVGIVWRPSDPRGAAVDAMMHAADDGSLGDLLGMLAGDVRLARQRYAEREGARGGNARTWACWRLRAEQTLALLEQHPPVS